MVPRAALIYLGVVVALPVGISTCAVNIGPLSDFAGDPYIIKVEWQPVLDGKPSVGVPKSITWTATGQALASFAERTETTSGGSATLQLPHVDQPGFVDGGGDAFTMWAYRVTVTAQSTVPRKTYRKTKVIQVLVGQTAADFDMIDDGTASVPVTAPTPTVTSVNGETGAVAVPTSGDVALLAPKESPTFTGTVSGVSKSMVGLSNVDNTSDANKPVSTAQAAADALKITAPLTPADGQLVQWSTSLNAWTIVNPTGNSLNASAVNSSAVTQTVTSTGGVGAAIDLTGMTISVTNSNGRPVMIHFSCGFKQTVVNPGSFYLSLYETTSGSVNKCVSVRELPNSVDASRQTITIPNTVFPIGAVTTTRTFKLTALLYTPAATTATALVYHGTTIPTLLRAVNE